jgi:hypothetical protein
MQAAISDPKHPLHGLVTRTIGGSGVSVNNDLRQETEESKVVGKGTGERRVAVEGAFTAAPEKLNRIALMQRLTKAVQTGRAAGVEGTLADLALGVGISPEMLSSVGLDPKLPAASQGLEMAVNQATMGMLGPGGFPTNNFSDGDRMFLTKVWPSILNRPEANDIILEVHKRAAERQLEAAEDWANAQESGKTFSQWEREFSKKVKGKDIFADVAKIVENIPSGKGTPPPGSPAPKGFKIIKVD